MDDVTGISTDEDRLDVGIYLLHLVKDVFPVHLRHDDVQNDQIDHLPVLPETVKRFVAIHGRDDPVAEHAEKLFRQFPHRGIVIDHEDRFRPPFEKHFRAGFPFRSRRLCPREVDFKGRPVARFAIDVDEAVMLLDDPIDDGQPQAGSLPHLLGGEKRLKDPLAHGFVHTLSGVGKRNHGIAAWFTETMRLDIIRIHFYRAGLKSEQASIRHGITGIGRQVHQDLFDLPAVGIDGQFFQAYQYPEIDIRSDDVLQEFFDLFDDQVQIDRLRIDDLFSAEGEQTAGQIDGPVGSRKHLDQIFSLGVVPGHVHLYQGAETDDGCKDIIEIMSHAPCQLAYGLHLLGLEELAFQCLAFGNVPVIADTTVMLPLGIMEGRTGNEEMAAKAGFVNFRQIGNALGQDLRVRTIWRRLVNAMNARVTDHADNFVRRYPKLIRHGPVDPRNLVTGIHNHDRINDGVKGPLPFHVHLPDLLLGPLAFGDIRNDAVAGTEDALPVIARRRCVPYPADPPILQFL